MAEEEKRIGVGVGIMVMRAGKVLLGKRNDDANKADSELHGEGTWTMPGGKIKYGESFEEAAIRELEEETGIELIEMRIMCVNNDKNEHAHFVTIGVLAKKYIGEAQVMEPEEITDWKWFEIKKVPKKLFEPSAKVLENYKQSRFYIEE
ncbi:MAG: NUDIX domain-containing protein [Candidatus Diapherotrites archaeon]|nr:NUDIX domain-containing protein [Candidatus Diapherotrites archaeon]